MSGGRKSKQSDTLYDRIRKRFHNNPLFVAIALIIPAAIAVFALMNAFKETKENYKEKITITVTLNELRCDASNYSSTYWDDTTQEFIERYIMDIAINNNSDESIVLASAELVPDWLYADSWGGPAEVSAVYNLVIDEWYTFCSTAKYPEMDSVLYKQLLQEKRIWQEGDLIWARPDPLRIDTIQNSKFVIEANSVDRFQIKLGLTESTSFLIGKVKLRLKTDTNKTLESKLFKIAVSPICHRDELNNHS